MGGKDMRNYNKYHEKSFITNYKLVGSSIVVYYDNGKKDLYPYRATTEKEIIEKMERQAQKIIEGPYVQYQKKLKLNLMLTPLVLVTSFFSSGIISLIICLIGVTCGVVSIKEYSRRIKDIKKMEFFLENKKELYESFELNNQKENCISKDNDDLSINTIDNYSLNDLRKLRNSIQQVNNRSKFKLNDEVKRLVLKR